MFRRRGFIVCGRQCAILRCHDIDSDREFGCQSLLFFTMDTGDSH